MKTLTLISTSLILTLGIGCSAPVSKPTFSKSKSAEANVGTGKTKTEGPKPIVLPTDGKDPPEPVVGDPVIEPTEPEPAIGSPIIDPIDPEPVVDDGTPPLGTKDGDYKLVWKEEFNSDKLDMTKWSYEVWKPGTVNEELQNYTDKRKENVRLENGSLILEARRDNFDGHEYSSGRIKSQGKAFWKYGKIEARIKLPGGKGTWPAFWMMPENQSRGWPACGEIDILEQVGFENDIVHATVHTQKYNWNNNNVKTASTPHAGITSGYHTYTTIWVPGKMEMFVDGRKYYTYTDEGSGDDAWPFNKEFHIILNLAVGGVWGGMQGVDANIWPRQMKVDWVRVWQK